MASTDLRVLSLNVRGIRSRRKRLNVFRQLKLNKYDIICLQETHILEHDLDAWKKEWGGDLFLSKQTSQSGGLVTLFSKRLSVNEATLEFSSPRLLAVKARIQDKTITIVNVYAPSDLKDKLLFFNKIEDTVKKIKTDNMLVCGDFNSVLSNSIDIVSGDPHDQRLVGRFNSFVIECDLYDSWRMFHPDVKQFSWSKNNPFIARRLDYILTSSMLFDKVIDSSIVSFSVSDHRGCSVTIRFSDLEQGPGYYKFNNSLLNDVNFVSGMNALINTFAPNNDDDPQTVWELLKIKMKEFAMNYGKKKGIKRKNEIVRLRLALNDLDATLASKPDCSETLKRRQEVKLQLELTELHDAKAAQVRSRMKWIEEGEKNTKFFLGLEKARANAKIMEQVKDVNGRTVTGQHNVLKVQTDYFKELYRKKIDCNNMLNNIKTFISNTNIPCLTEEEKNNCERDLTETEVAEALKAMKNGSCPGSDGLTIEFYKVFWPLIKEFLLPSFNSAFETGKMSQSQRKAIITLIHKGKDLTKDEMNNWRPISLTNTDYKLLAKTMALSLSDVIVSLVSEDQTGYIKGRNVSTMLRLIDDVTDSMNKQNNSGLLVTLDFFHAFDCISKNFMMSVFKVFGFGENFATWVSVLMSETMSCVNYCGYLSEFFAVGSGIRQGCPFSPLAFVLSVEILSIALKASPDIQGINLNFHFNTSIFIKILLYADDLTLFLKNEHELCKAMKICNEFSLLSGLFINKKKSEAMWLGNRKNCTIAPSGFPLKNKVKILGVYFSNYSSASKLEENWNNRLSTCKRIIAQWEKRNLSIMGKACIIKTFLISQWVYIMQVISVPEQVVNEANRLFYKFLWKKVNNNKKAFEKVKRTVMCSKYEMGGIQMIDLKDLQKACQLRWATRIFREKDNKLIVLVKNLFFGLGCHRISFLATVRSNVFKGLSLVKSYFWNDVLKTWLDNNVTEKNDISQILWNNKDLIYQRNAMFYPNWIRAGVCSVQDMLDENNQILSFQDICIKIGNSPSLFLEYKVVYSAVSSFLLKHSIFSPVLTDNLIFCGKKVFSLKEFRTMLIERKEATVCAASFWKRKFNFDMTPLTWLMPQIATKETRLRLLQWKINHNIYPTNIMLSKMKVTENNKCSYCPETVDVLEHFFYECPIVLKFWHDIELYIQVHFHIHIKISKIVALFGMFNTNLDELYKINHILLLAKTCISIFKKTNSTQPLLDIFATQNALRLKLYD